ncbi:ABC transporter ATP-binding protein [Rhodococcus fascians]|nr:ABC transporter ATP-binding protein [Rhodococcus fascians]
MSESNSVATIVDPIAHNDPDAGPSQDWPESAKIVARQVERSFPKRRGTVQALGPIDFQANDGEFVCVVGPSGCGKSTFLRVVASLIEPTGGAIGIRSAAAAPVATVFQDSSIFPWKTVEENIRFGLDLVSKDRAENSKRAMAWAAKLGLSDFTEAYPSTLSGGMRQRVAIARALAVEPEVLLMDEPFAALDAQMRLVLQEELLRLWQADRRTVLFVTHSLEEAILLGDRILVMSARPGKIVADFKVPFARPRTPEIRGTAEFADLHENMWEILREEVTQAYASTEGKKS